MNTQSFHTDAERERIRQRIFVLSNVTRARIRPRPFMDNVAWQAAVLVCAAYGIGWALVLMCRALGWV